MLRALALAVLVLPAPITSLDVQAPDPPGVRAGEPVEHEVPVRLEGPSGPMPGASGPVNVTLAAPPGAACSAPDRVLLDPATGRAPVPLDCRPPAAGEHALELTARSPPHASATWNGTLGVVPDLLRGDLSAGEPDGYRVPVDVGLGPEHLDAARANLTVEAHRRDASIGLVAHEEQLRVTEDTARSLSVPAQHGPGTYEILADAEGPNVEPLQVADTVTVPAPPDQGRVDLNVTVEPGKPNVTLADDSVNSDGVNKRPGDTLYTRLEAQHTDQVNVTVRRPTGDEDVTIARETVPVDEEGRAEHTFQHHVLPEGLLRVVATAGNSSTARTAQVQDLDADASATLPGSVLGDGRPVEGTLVIEDPNHGSTPADPAPVWGLPDVTWTVYRGSVVAGGFTVQVGAFDGGSQGEAATSTIPWPSGTDWARVDDGRATMDLAVTPPSDVDPGTYRLSLYGPDGDRVGGASVDLEPAPSVDLAAPEPVPGEAWPVEVALEDRVPGTTANVTVTADGEPVATRTANVSGTLDVDLPAPLPAGATVQATANATWPGRPQTGGSDARLAREVPALAPRLDVHPSLDGVPAPEPVAAHPDHAHELALNPAPLDPNGGKVSIAASVTDPDGEATGWVEDGEHGPVARLPAGAEAGRYTATVRAEGPDGVAEATVPVDVAEIARVRASAVEPVNVTEGEAVERALTLRNAGTVLLEGLLVQVDAPESLAVDLAANGTELAPGEPAPIELAPGETREVTATVRAGVDAAGTHRVGFTLAGVTP